MTYHDACDCGRVTIETAGAPDGSAGLRGNRDASGKRRRSLSRIFRDFFADCFTDPRLAGLFFASHLGATSMALILLSLSMAKDSERRNRSTGKACSR